MSRRDEEGEDDLLVDRVTTGEQGGDIVTVSVSLIC